jgi:hypothetical protein
MTIYVCLLIKKFSCENRSCLFSKEQMNELFSKYKDDPENDTIHVRRLSEVLQAFGKNPSQKDCEQRISELEENGKRKKKKKSFFLIFIFILFRKIRINISRFITIT